MSNIDSARLPERPDLEHLKKQAKQLLRRVHDGDRQALSELAASVRRVKDDTDPKTLTLAEAQHALARRYGFTSWTLLKQEVQRRNASALAQGGLPADREQRMDLMYRAIEQRNAELVRMLLAHDPALADGWGERRPMLHAAEHDAPQILDIFLDAGVKPDADYGYPHAPLSWAITVRSLHSARRLAERGAVVDLWCAAGFGDVERMRAYFDESGRPLPGASRHGATRYDAEGKPLPKPPPDPNDMLSDALYIACRNGQLEAAAFLLEHGASPAFEGFAMAPALHWAAFSGNHALVELLLTHGADPGQRDGTYQATYRQFAVRNAIEWSWHSALERALSGDATLAHEQSGAWGPPLHAAAMKGLTGHVELLLDAGADPSARDHAGRTLDECLALVDNQAAVAEIRELLARSGQQGPP